MRGVQLLNLFQKTWFFFLLHTILAILIFDLFIFTPDEIAYLETFSRLFDKSFSNPTWGSGWFGAPVIFLKLLYFPAYLVTLLGIPDFLALRLISIVLISLSFSLCKSSVFGNIKGKTGSQASNLPILLFYVPSVFLWTTTGLRESFILFGITLIFYSFCKIDIKTTYFGYFLLISGSYFLISTKFYLWIIVAISIFISLLLVTLKTKDVQTSLLKILASIIIPFCIFALTVQGPVLQFLLESVRSQSIQSAGEREGGSRTTVTVPSKSGVDLDTGSTVTVPSKSGVDLDTGSEVVVSELVVSGDYTLIAVHNYIENKPRAFVTRVMEILGLDSIVDKRYQEVLNKTADAKASTDAPNLEAQSDPSSLKAGKISEPVSLVAASIVFILGQIPLMQSKSLFLDITAWESPIWWFCYLVIMFQFSKAIRFSKPIPSQIILPTITFFLLVAFSALVEVNAGTAFRHRSILLPSLIFMLIGLQKSRELKSN